MAISKDNLIEVLRVSDKWKEDRFGHFKQEICVNGNIKKYRIKIQEISIRLEAQSIFDDGRKEWFKITGAYFKDIVKIDHGVYRIGSYKVKI